MNSSPSQVDDVARKIRDAMGRLIEGQPIRSDGKLTIKSLAIEAGVKRWILTHQRPDLQQEFRDLCARQGKTPANQKILQEKLELMVRQLEKYKIKVSDLSEENNRLTRVVQVLSLENDQLRDKLDRQPGKVHHIK